MYTVETPSNSCTLSNSAIASFITTVNRTLLHTAKQPSIHCARYHRHQSCYVADGIKGGVIHIHILHKVFPEWFQLLISAPHLSSNYAGEGGKVARALAGMQAGPALLSVSLLTRRNAWHCWRAGAIQLRSGHEMYNYSYKHVLRSKHVTVGIYMHMEYKVCSMNYKACSRDMHMK